MITQLGPYFIDEALAEGGMARVFRARLRGPGGFEKQLVLKQIKPELARDPQFVELFVREANLLVSLSHPHIVQVYELGAVDGTYYISMEYVEGATVAELLSQGALSPALTAHLGAQICEALDYAHGRFGILHRDITPRNIIVDEAGHARLLDFGIATTERAAACTWLGSPGYMSPEQVERAPLSPASDMFALGCVLYEALCGKPAFEKHLRASLGQPPLLKETAELPESLAGLVRRLLARPPEQRPSAKEAARVLRAYLAQARPEGVLEEMQQRAAQARRERERRRAEPSTPVAGVTRTAPVETRSIATSPVLTEMLRSAPGMPHPAPEVDEAHTQPLRETSTDGGTERGAENPRARPLRATVAGTDAKTGDPHTRPLRTTHGGDHAQTPKVRARRALTRRMLQSWPALAVLALGASLALAAQRAQRQTDALEPGQASPLAPVAGREPPTPSHRTEPIPKLAANPSEGSIRSSRAPDASRAITLSAGTSRMGPNTGITPPQGGPMPAAGEPPDTSSTGLPSERASVDLATAGRDSAEAGVRATLSINAVPWAEVRIDGRPHGTTPLRRLKLRPGLHRLSVRCPPLDRSAELVVELAPKADARIAVDLQRSPVRTFLDGAKEVR